MIVGEYSSEQIDELTNDLVEFKLDAGSGALRHPASEVLSKLLVDDPLDTYWLRITLFCVDFAEWQEIDLDNTTFSELISAITAYQIRSLKSRISKCDEREAAELN